MQRDEVNHCSHLDCMLICNNMCVGNVVCVEWSHLLKLLLATIWFIWFNVWQHLPKSFRRNSTQVWNQGSSRDGRLRQNVQFTSGMYASARYWSSYRSSQRHSIYSQNMTIQQVQLHWDKFHEFVLTHKTSIPCGSFGNSIAIPRRSRCNRVDLYLSSSRHLTCAVQIRSLWFLPSENDQLQTMSAILPASQEYRVWYA